MRWMVAALTGVAVFGIAAVLFPHDRQERGAEPPFQTDVSGRAKVIDGDSVYVGNVEVRLFGVDAPEAMQACEMDGTPWRCGLQAAQALRGLIEGRVVVCEERDQDTHGRIVAVCRHGDTDINAWLVTNGWALAYRRYGHDYVEAESLAKSARLGVWRGVLTAPWDWRQASSQGGEVSSAPARTAAMAQPPGCNIKGNIGSGGKRYYHEPGDRDYERTQINRAGEQWFCSAADARAAGWQPANPANRRQVSSRGGEVSSAPARPAATAQPPGCNIKGNIGSGGERYYHEPGDRDYERTRINRTGERWFCSATEARRAGWQPANPAKR